MTRTGEGFRDRGRAQERHDRRFGKALVAGEPERLDREGGEIERPEDRGQRKVLNDVDYRNERRSP
ncbi:MAG: hypothetical protein ACOC2Y_09860, partial [Spirochaetota bacterium]